MVYYGTSVKIYGVTYGTTLRTYYATLVGTFYDRYCISNAGRVPAKGTITGTEQVECISKVSLCVHPDTSGVWTISPPTHCTHAYLTSVHHRAVASASVRLCLHLRACLSMRVRSRSFSQINVHTP